MKSDIPGQKQKQKKKKTVNVKWIVTIFLSTVLISAVFSSVSSGLLSEANMISAFLILLVIVLIGILFDIIGVAVTAADPKPFHSMAAHKAHGAQEALAMLRNAEKVSSFCNDVVGDICGIISGATGALIVTHIIAGTDGATKVLVSLLITGLISAGTIGGKAAGKGIAVAASGKVLALCGRVLSVLPLKLDNKR